MGGVLVVNEVINLKCLGMLNRHREVPDKVATIPMLGRFLFN